MQKKSLSSDASSLESMLQFVKSRARDLRIVLVGSPEKRVFDLVQSRIRIDVHIQSAAEISAVKVTN